MCSTAENIPARRFWTPPAARNSRVRESMAMTMSERKVRWPSQHRNDLFHIIHKVPSGDSPYVRAKHVQLIEKDLERAVALFWAAINAGDRVDSALKDMVVVMKQLNRCDEAIEAIKSFRHMCPYDSQESIDNLLFELYKKSGRVEEETELLERKLRNIEAGIWLGGKLTKTMRCQGKKVEVDIEQEKARVLGNLAWVHLQQSNYGIAERYYRKALYSRPDKNKQCNLAICLMNMDRIDEAKSLLQNIKDSCEDKEGEESYSKSYERALKTLVEIESRQGTDARLNSEYGFYDTEGSKHMSIGSISDLKFSPYSRALLTQPQGFEEESHRKEQIAENMIPPSVRRLSFGGAGFDGDVNGVLTQRNQEQPVALTGALTQRNKEPPLALTRGILDGKRLDRNLIHGLHEFITGKEKMGGEVSTDRAKKTWADIVEEEEEHHSH